MGSRRGTGHVYGVNITCFKTEKSFEMQYKINRSKTLFTTATQFCYHIFRV